jgi:hypothetical protein
VIFIENKKKEKLPDALNKKFREVNRNASVIEVESTIGMQKAAN